MPFIHKQLAAGRWSTLTYAEQLGNLGSEVGRTIRASEAGDPERKALAFARALELLDLTLADPHRAGEGEKLLRLRATLCDVFQGENASGHFRFPQELFSGVGAESAGGAVNRHFLTPHRRRLKREGELILTIKHKVSLSRTACRVLLVRIRSTSLGARRVSEQAYVFC